jgi:hypothetical protein
MARKKTPLKVTKPSRPKLSPKKKGAKTTSEPALEPLNQLVGTWATEATHPAVPGVVVRGTIVVEWLEGERFLSHRACTDHPDFPDALSIIGFTDQDRIDHTGGSAPLPDKPQLTMHYFDSRGVFRVFDVSIDKEAFRFWRNAPGFSQRFTGTFADKGETIVGRTQLCQDNIHWNDDLQITYRRHK